MAAEEGRRRGLVLVNLPQEILEEILSRLPLNAIRRCMVLSKRIYRVITSYTFYERWIGANLRPDQLIVFSQGTETFSEGSDDDEAVMMMMNSIDSLDLSDFDQPRLPDASGFVEMLNPLEEGSEDTLVLHGSSKGLLLIEVKKEEEQQKLHIWNPSFRRMLGPGITLPQGFDGQQELQVGFGHSQGAFYVLLISPLVEGEPAGLLTVETHLLRVGRHLENQAAWTLVRSPVQLSAGSFLSHNTTNALNDETVLWSVRDGTTHWSIQGFSFATRSFIPNIAFPVWQGDGARNLPIVKVLGGRVYAYRAAAGGVGESDPVVLWRLGEGGEWAVQASFNMINDFPDEKVLDAFKEVVAVTNEHGRLFVYTSEDRLIGYDPGTQAYFFFGDRGRPYGAIDDLNYPQLPELRVVAYHPSLIWPYSRFAGEDI